MLSIAPPETTSASLADFENVDNAEVAQMLLEAARVKWFDKAKRFGFANIWGSSELFAVNEQQFKTLLGCRL